MLLGFEQLIIRAAADDLDFQLRDGIVVENGAERAGSENIRLLAVDGALGTARKSDALNASVFSPSSYEYFHTGSLSPCYPHPHKLRC